MMVRARRYWFKFKKAIKRWRVIKRMFSKRVRFSAPNSRWGLLRLLTPKRLIVRRTNEFGQFVNVLRYKFNAHELGVGLGMHPLVLCRRGVTVDTAAVNHGQLYNSAPVTTARRKFGLPFIRDLRLGVLFGGTTFLKLSNLTLLLQGCLLDLSNNFLSLGKRRLVEGVSVRAGGGFESYNTFLAKVSNLAILTNLVLVGDRDLKVGLTQTFGRMFLSLVGLFSFLFVAPMYNTLGFYFKF